MEGDGVGETGNGAIPEDEDGESSGQWKAVLEEATPEPTGGSSGEQMDGGCPTCRSIFPQP